MNANTIEIAPEEQVFLLNNLTRLLEEQINIARHGDMNGRQIENISEQTETLVKDIVEAGLFELEELRHQREQIKRLYNSLSLAIIARRDEADKQIKQIRKGKKTIEVYRNSI